MLPTEIFKVRDNLKACIQDCMGLYKIGVSTSRPQRMLDELMVAIGSELSQLQESIAMHQQNERCYAIREKELQDQNDALRSANSSIHTARLDSLTDIQNLKEQVRKLDLAVQGMMNPVEIIDAPDCFNPTCECNSCKWERHNAAQKVTHPTDTNGYGVVGSPRDGD